MAKKKFTTYLHEEDIKQLKIVAANLNISVAQILDKLISDFLNNSEV